MADVVDSKSTESNLLRVQVPFRAPNTIYFKYLFDFNTLSNVS